MSSHRFIALPVGQGDAFFLSTPEGSVLVDGGRSVEGFGELFRSATGRSQVDVVVCTHNDADHANGLIGFFRAGLSCREIWLPGRWFTVLPHVLRPTEQIFIALWEQASEAASDRRLRDRIEASGPHSSGGTPLEIVGDRIAQDPEWFDEHSGRRGQSSDGDANDGWPSGLVDDLEQSSPSDPFAEYPWGSDYLTWRLWAWHLRPPFRSPEPLRDALFKGALVAAERIRLMAAAAYHAGAKVRWFEHDPRTHGGGNRWLRSLNAVPLVYIPHCPQGALLWRLALTVTNRESLVFWAPSPQRAGVLFTADSDLDDVHLPDLEGAVVTAPHHGSESNAAAYSAVSSQATRGVNWVRSDGKSRSRPGPAFLNAGGKRCCTLCRSATSLPKQAVDFFSRSGGWVRNRPTRACSCRPI